MFVLVGGVVRAGGPEWRARNVGLAGLVTSSRCVVPGTWSVPPVVGGRAGGTWLDWLRVLDVKKQQPDPSRVPGAYLRHAPNDQG